MASKKTSTKTATSASGKQVDPERMREAEKEAVVGLKERIAEGIRASGLYNAVTDEVLQRSATDDAIGDFSWALTEDEKLLQVGGPRSDFRSTDPWRVMRI